MKKTQRKILGLLLSTLAISFLIYACVDDNLHKMEESDRLVSGKNKELTKEMAEQWFLAYNTPVVELRSAEVDDGVRTKPNWSRAKESRKKRYEVVETPLLSKDNIRFLDEDTKNRMDRSTDNKYIRNTTRMVVIKDLQSGKVCSFFMIFVGTYDYLKRTKNMGKNGYFQRESDFEGKVLFYSPKGGLINGWQYENGKITGRISPKSSESSISLRGGYLDCWDDEYYVETEYCVTTGYMDNELGYVETGEECVPNGGYYESYQVCDWVDDGDDDDYGYVDDDYWNNNPEYNGGSPGATDPYIKIFKTTGLDNNSLNTLKNILKDLSKQKGYKQMLSVALQKPLTNISINTSLKNPGGYYTSSQSMVFRSDADLKEAFNEELIHHIQNVTYTNGIDQYDKNRGGLCNIEFEAKVLQDILCMMNTGACPSYGATQANGNAYTNWIGDVCDWGEWMPAQSNLEMAAPGTGGKGYWEFLEDFNNDPNRQNYHSPINYNLETNVINYFQTAINQNK